MKRTPLYEEHVKLGAKIVDFAGFEMPVQYSGVVVEHNAVRNAAGLFDVSHMGEFEFRGPGALAFLNALTANDVAKLTDGKAQYSLLCNEQGGIVDDILVYRLAADHFWMVVNAANIEKDWNWVIKIKNEKFKTENCEIKNISDETCLLALQGPRAIEVAKTLTQAPVAELKSFHACVGTAAGRENCLIGRTGYTGEDGVEIFCKAPQAAPLWRAILEAGKTAGIKPAGLGARDTLRLEARLSLYGHEINDETNPLEAGLGWVVKLDKPDFIGKNPIVKIKEAGLKRTLVGFKMCDKSIARQGFAIVAEEKTIGHVTSGSYSPTLAYGIGLGYAPTAFEKIGTKFNIDIRGKQRLAEVVTVPFYKRRAM